MNPQINQEIQVLINPKRINKKKDLIIAIIIKQMNHKYLI
jgi:hypothetical protein